MSGRGEFHQRSFVERRQNLLVDRSLIPPVCSQEEVVCLLWIDAGDQSLAHMLMGKAQRMSGLVPDDALVFRLRRIHGESLQIHCLPVLWNMQDIGSEIGPVTAGAS